MAPRLVYLSSQPLAKEKIKSLNIDFNLIKPLHHRELVQLIQTTMAEPANHETNNSLILDGYDPDVGTKDDPNDSYSYE